MAGLAQTARLPLAPPASMGAKVSDLFALTKPSITANVVLTATAGMGLAPGRVSLARALVALFGTALVVSGANALNCYVERESDARMWRTRSRPLAAGRLAPQDGLLLGLVLAIVAVPLLTFAVNPLTGLLALLALLSYVGLYTPLKRVTPKALAVGAVPGAIPPLLGWTAVTGHLDFGGVLLFALMFTWQLPHFLAITLYLKEDYARGGHRVLPLVRGERATHSQLRGWSIVLVLLSLGFWPLGVAGTPYAVAAALLGVGFLGVAWRGTARQIFLCSIGYLLALLGAMVVSHLWLHR